MKYNTNRSLKSRISLEIPKNQDFSVHLNQSRATVATLNQKGGRGHE